MIQGLTANLVTLHSDKIFPLPPNLYPGELNIPELKSGSSHIFCFHFMKESIKTTSLCQECPGEASSLTFVHLLLVLVCTFPQLWTLFGLVGVLGALAAKPAAEG